jgi:Protein of unknown function (DUF2971)
MLFKYCSFARAIDILKSKRIRFTQPSDFNDPFELHPEFQLMSQEDIADLPPALDKKGQTIPSMRQLTPEAMHRMFGAIIPYITQMAPIYQKYPGAAFAIDNNAVGRSHYDSNFGILSLTEAPDNLLMWAHYGDSHKGIVLGFDESHSFFQGSEIVAGLERLSKVEYNQKRPVLSPSTRDNPKLFLRKSTEWAYEREWRLIRPLNESVDVISRDNLMPLFLFEIPHDSIKHIIIGSQVNQIDQQEIVKYIDSIHSLTHIKIHYMILSRELYKIEIHPVITE